MGYLHSAVRFPLFEALLGLWVNSSKSRISGSTDVGKKKILLLKGKEREIPHVSGSMLLQQSATSVKNSLVSSSLKQNQRHEASGRIIRSVLLNKEARQSQSSSVVNSEQQIRASNLEKGRRPPRPQMQMFLKDTNGTSEAKVIGNDFHGFSSEKKEKRTRNKDRPDRGVWTSFRRSEGSHASDESLSSFVSQSTHLQLESAEGMVITELESGSKSVVTGGYFSAKPVHPPPFFCFSLPFSCKTLMPQLHRCKWKVGDEIWVVPANVHAQILPFLCGYNL
ncbi:hypothetical protein U1Q18_035508 [Sarracenia purpurea var. burkii]